MQETNKLNSRNTTCSCWLTSTDKRRLGNPLDASERLIALIICSTCFGHLYAHYQELETILVYYRIWCVMPWLLVVGGQVQDCRLCVRVEGICSTADRRLAATKASHTMCGSNTSIVSSSWWRAYKCPKHVEQIISAINHSVASSWFSTLCILCLLIKSGGFPVFE